MLILNTAYHIYVRMYKSGRYEAAAPHLGGGVPVVDVSEAIVHACNECGREAGMHWTS